MHQAGSDSLLTAQTFFRLCAVSFDGLNNLSDEKFKGELFGCVQDDERAVAGKDAKFLKPEHLKFLVGSLWTVNSHTFIRPVYGHVPSALICCFVFSFFFCPPLLSCVPDWVITIRSIGAKCRIPIAMAMEVSKAWVLLCCLFPCHLVVMLMVLGKIAGVVYIASDCVLEQCGSRQH